MRIPSGWHRAEQAVTSLTDPVETLVVATYRPRAGSERCGPLSFEGFDANEALVVVLERGLDPHEEWSDFPRRPAHFAYEPGQTTEFADSQQPMDEVVDTEGVKLLIDPKASLFLIGTEMDYEEEKLKSGFVFKNPNAKGRCGCGESFHV